jgi:hypothetical protein
VGGPIDALMSVLPERWRKEAALIVLGASLGIAYMVFDARVADAVKAAKEQPQLKAQIVDLQTSLGALKQQNTDIQSNVSILVGAILGQKAIGHGAERADAPTPKPQ